MYFTTVVGATTTTVLFVAAKWYARVLSQVKTCACNVRYSPAGHYISTADLMLLLEGRALDSEVGMSHIGQQLGDGLPKYINMYMLKRRGGISSLSAIGVHLILDKKTHTQRSAIVCGFFVSDRLIGVIEIDWCQQQIQRLLGNILLPPTRTVHACGVCFVSRVVSSSPKSSPWF